jgi:5-methylcytosine-specific restriction endonuclease McrA
MAELIRLSAQDEYYCKGCDCLWPRSKFYPSMILNNQHLCRACHDARNKPRVRTGACRDTRTGRIRTEEQKRRNCERTRKRYAENPEVRRRNADYWKSLAGRAAAARYRQTEGYRRAQRRAYHEGTRKVALKRYRQTPKGRESALRGAHKRRARDKSVVNPVTAEAWKIVLAKFDHRCAYCGRGDMSLTRDHVVPLSRGGTHDAENIVPACKPCNSSKATKLPSEWVR